MSATDKYSFRESQLVADRYQIVDSDGNCIGVFRDLSDAAMLVKHLNSAYAAGQQDSKPDPWLVGSVESWEKNPPTKDRAADNDAKLKARAELREVMDECGWDIYGGSTEPWVRAMNYAWEEGFLEGYTTQTQP